MQAFIVLVEKIREDPQFVSANIQCLELMIYFVQDGNNSPGMVLGNSLPDDTKKRKCCS